MAEKFFHQPASSKTNWRSQFESIRCDGGGPLRIQEVYIEFRDQVQMNRQPTETDWFYNISNDSVLSVEVG